jgi:Rrf2 family protein
VNLLNRSTDYAIRALIYMAEDADRIVSTADLDRDLKLPRPFMRKTLQMLQKAGYLTSVKGGGGGFRLEREPKDIKLIDLMKVFQGDISLGDCLFKKKICTCVRTCPLRREIKSMEAMVLGRLKSVTLFDLIGDHKN